MSTEREKRLPRRVRKDAVRRKAQAKPLTTYPTKNEKETEQ